MSTVILAEKPNQAKAYAEAFQHNTRRNGYFEVSDSILSEKTFITYGIGHLVHLAEPGYYDDKWKTWNKDALPIFPRKYEFLVSEDKEKQFKVVSNLLKRASTIVIATDCDREGENSATCF